MKDYLEDEYDIYEEEYGVGGFLKNKSHKRIEKNGKRGKGHQKRKKESEYWDEMIEKEDSEDNFNWNSNKYEDQKPIVEEKPEEKPIIKQPESGTPAVGTKIFTPGPNTHTIKGNIIDFDRVANVEKVENERNGRLTYGIKFLFQGKKGSFRIAWFNQNIKERDRVFENEYNFWISIK